MKYLIIVDSGTNYPMFKATGWVVGVQACESQVMGSIPTQWTSMLYWYVVSWLKLLPVHKFWWTPLADGKMVLQIPISGVCV
jgi:hypothetical protein